jgi:hypothetical protein
MTHPKDQLALAIARDSFAAWKIHGALDLEGAWLGWRLRGRDLVSPDGDRISPTRLRGLMFLEAVTRRKVRRAAKPAAVAPVLQLQDDREKRLA